MITLLTKPLRQTDHGRIFWLEYTSSLRSKMRQWHEKTKQWSATEGIDLLTFQLKVNYSTHQATETDNSAMDFQFVEASTLRRPKLSICWSPHYRVRVRNNFNELFLCSISVPFYWIALQSSWKKSYHWNTVKKWRCLSRIRTYSVGIIFCGVNELQ